MVRGIMVLGIPPREALLAAVVALPVVGDDTPVHRESTLSRYSTLFSQPSTIYTSIHSHAFRDLDCGLLHAFHMPGPF
jgi:hypothetical protein